MGDTGLPKRLATLDLGGFADFKVPFISAGKFSASVCGSVEQDCSVASIYCSIGIFSLLYHNLVLSPEPSFLHSSVHIARY